MAKINILFINNNNNNSFKINFFQCYLIPL